MGYISVGDYTLIAIKVTTIMSKILKSDISYLFDELWPLMPYAQEHKRICLKKFTSIKNYFAKYPLPENHNELLNGLNSLDGIGITIATGIIWSVYRNIRVPFDKYTLTYALKEKIIRTDKISKNYISVSKSISNYCSTYVINDRDYEIEDFVRDAMEEMKGEDYLTEPK